MLPPPVKWQSEVLNSRGHEMNLGYSYYHEKENSILDFGRGIVGRSKSADLADLQEKYFKIEGDNIFSVTFKIRYPGLLVGLGYEHPKLSDNNDDFESGFTFDYTTGLPYIPGSSVKGVIRSAFPKQAEDAGRLEFVNELLGEKLSYSEIRKNELLGEKLSYNKIRKAENRLFGNRSDEEREFPHACQDIFYDGYISRISGQLFAEEYITPHKDPVSNPIPIKFLKIAPGNEITLQFGLNDAGENHLTRDRRIKLYTEIILFLGLGAKKNVGFGQFDEDFTKNKLKQILDGLEASEKKREEAEAQKRLAAMSPVERIFEQFKGELPHIINAMKAGKIEEAILKDLAKAVRDRLVMENIWDRPKKPKDIGRVQYIADLLKK